MSCDDLGTAIDSIGIFLELLRGFYLDLQVNDGHPKMGPAGGFRGTRHGRHRFSNPPSDPPTTAAVMGTERSNSMGPKETMEILKEDRQKQKRTTLASQVVCFSLESSIVFFLDAFHCSGAVFCWSPLWSPLDATIVTSSRAFDLPSGCQSAMKAHEGF